MLLNPSSLLVGMSLVFVLALPQNGLALDPEDKNETSPSIKTTAVYQRKKQLLPPSPLRNSCSGPVRSAQAPSGHLSCEQRDQLRSEGHSPFRDVIENKEPKKKNFPEELSTGALYFYADNKKERTGKQVDLRSYTVDEKGNIKKVGQNND